MTTSPINALKKLQCKTHQQYTNTFPPKQQCSKKERTQSKTIRTHRKQSRTYIYQKIDNFQKKKEAMVYFIMYHISIIRISHTLYTSYIL